LRGYSTLVEKNQSLRRDPAERFLEGLPPPLVLFRVAFAGVE